jgi:hypothetical protein
MYEAKTHALEKPLYHSRRGGIEFHPYNYIVLLLKTTRKEMFFSKTIIFLEKI